MFGTERVSSDGVRLHWNDAGPRRTRATSFAVYRVDGDASHIDVEDPANLVATVRGTGQVVQDWLDTSAVDGRGYTYVVTALDRLWNESAPSRTRSV